jgi:hypothetical protein
LVPHGCPHAPQLSWFTVVSVQWPPQSTPDAQAHTPRMHDSVPTHAWPHDPQFARSVATVAHVAPHISVPAGHTVTHVAAAPVPLHICPAAQAWPHVPQFAGVSSVTSHPSSSRPLQSAVPSAHCTM